jgi:SAM-dependent methyltransferase
MLMQGHLGDGRAKRNLSRTVANRPGRVVFCLSARQVIGRGIRNSTNGVGMSERRGYLDRIYSVRGADALRRHYDEWAESYDGELAAAEYRTPERCAAALARHLADRAAPVLDFACGTGLSGEALGAAGFTCIDGTDVSSGMMEQARRKGIYRKLWQCAPDERLAVRERGYAGIVAAGAISPGAAPARCVDDALDSLAAGGLFVLSLNDHALEDADFVGRITGAAQAGQVEILEAGDGPHLPAMGLKSRVYALRRL